MKIPESILDLPNIKIIGIAGTNINQQTINKLKMKYPHIGFITINTFFTKTYNEEHPEQ